MYPSFLRIKGSSDSCSMSQVAEENVASAQVPAVSELEALGTLRNKNNMFEFLCGKYYLSMSNTICFLSQTSCCFLWEEISGSNITWKCICLYVLPLSFPFAVRPRLRCKQRLWRLRSSRVGRPHVPRAVLTCTCTYQVRIEFQFVSKQLRLECKERTHAGNCILVLDRYTLWSLIGLSSGWHRIKRSIWRLALALFHIKRNFPLPSMEDAKTIVNQYCQMKDWIGQA